ncbi:M15 family metallopeptidase [Cellulomonas sp. PhB150]|uniref:M15 family metallopeptidase n=1 Tax=Cellulomonas sp. PhB150 TaxID=2485188 RepID=UPI000F943D86|nr:M15 family metallopeptidase [Cellulomonas sp. PhB150]ROS27804.1 D-alanyl-D-alanine carboxypeptidase-like protein [Cellulomonas sp. PhB150]
MGSVESASPLAPLTRRELREAERRAQEAAAAAAAPAPAPAAPTRAAQRAISRPGTSDHPAGVPAWTSGAAAHPARPTSAPRTTHGAFVSGADRPDAVDPRPAPRGTASAHTPHGVTSSLDPRAAMPTTRPEPARTPEPEPEQPRPTTAFSTARYGVKPPAARPAPAPAGFVPAQVNGSWQSDIRAVDARLVRETPAEPARGVRPAEAPARPAKQQPDERRAAAPAAPLYPAVAPEELSAAEAVTEAVTTAIPAATHSSPAFPAVAPEVDPAPLAASPSTDGPEPDAQPAAALQPSTHHLSRALRRQAAAPTNAKKSHRRPARAATRLGVLTALAAVTVVIPVSQGAIAGTAVISGEPLTNATLPSTVSALTAAPASMLPPASLVPTDGAVSVRALAAAASRDETRSLLPGCDPAVRAPGSNGLLAEKDLCTLWDGHTRLRADAASSLAEFNAAYVARFGADMCLASGYRTLAEQRSVKATRGGLAAAPGKSNHGWGLATDFCSELTYGERWTWINANAPTFGWENPAWAKPGGSGPFEKWHWEYTKGVKADGEYYG